MPMVLLKFAIQRRVCFFQLYMQIRCRGNKRGRQNSTGSGNLSYTIMSQGESRQLNLHFRENKDLVLLDSAQWHTDQRFNPRGWAKSPQVHILCKECMHCAQENMICMYWWKNEDTYEHNMANKYAAHRTKGYQSSQLSVPNPNWFHCGLQVVPKLSPSCEKLSQSGPKLSVAAETVVCPLSK